MLVISSKPDKCVCVALWPALRQFFFFCFFFPFSLMEIFSTRRSFLYFCEWKERPYSFFSQCYRLQLPICVVCIFGNWIDSYVFFLLFFWTFSVRFVWHVADLIFPIAFVVVLNWKLFVGLAVVVSIVIVVTVVIRHSILGYIFN